MSILSICTWYDQDMEGRDKLALLDIDHTLYRGNSLYDWMRVLIVLGRMSQQAYDEELRIKEDFLQGKIPYEEFAHGVIVRLVQALRGQEETVLDALALEFVGDHQYRLYPFTKGLLHRLDELGYEIFFVTNSPFVGRAFHRLFGSAGYFQSEYQIHEGLVTGEVVKTLADREMKRQIAHQLIKVGKYQKTLAMGDSPGDLGMLGSVDVPIVVGQNPAVCEVAQGNKWLVVTGERVDEVKNVIV